MKVVHISTYDTGGAATAALRLHAGLLKMGADSSFLSLQVSGGLPYPSTYGIQKVPTTLTGRVLRRAGIPISQKERNERMLTGLTGTYEIFTFPLTDYRIETHPLLQDADVVNLHWVADLINYPTFFRTVTKPLVWTLHDMNPMMGGFHYPGDNERNTSWRSLEEKLRKIKEASFNNLKNLRIVTPSEWMRKHLASYAPLARFNHSCIPYGLDLTVFKPHNKQFAREVFNIAPDKKVLLFVSDRIENFRKGFDILQQALQQLNLYDTVQLVTIGMASNDAQQSNHILPMGMIKDERLMALLFSAADLFILPSREDNLPNVMLESLACGTPVLSFTNGGMPEVIRHGFTGILLEDISADSLRDGIVQFLDGSFSFEPREIREFMVRNFDLTIQASRYLELYRQILN